MLDIPTPFMKNSQKAILYALAIKGPCYGYELYKKSFRAGGELGKGLSDKTVYVELKKLKTRGFVDTQESGVETKKRKKGRPGEARYSLTLLGLCYALATTKSDSFTPVGPALAKWSSLVPSINSMMKAVGKDFIFESNLCRSFGDIVATACMESYYIYDICEDAIIFDLIYHFYDRDLRPPFLGMSIFIHFRPIFLNCPEFEKKAESFAKILWLDSKWRTLLYEERKLLFEQPFANDFTKIVPTWSEDQEALGAKEVYHELETTLAEWPISFKQFLKLKALHEIWIIKEGEFGLEYSSHI